jgi:hypothetical protein
VVHRISKSARYGKGYLVAALFIHLDLRLDLLTEQQEALARVIHHLDLRMKKNGAVSLHRQLVGCPGLMGSSCAAGFERYRRSLGRH